MSITTSTSTSQGEGPILEDKPKEPKEARLLNAPRCQARTKRGPPCRSPAVRGKRACRMHGGGKGSGAPNGRANGMFRHGGWTREAVAARREASALLRKIKGLS